jgi:NAD(P)H-hydrate epimerase
MKVVTRERMRWIDEVTINEYGLPSLVLMENAGSGAFRVILEEYPQVKKGKVAVICGSGNNGGDGFVVARWLHCEGVNVVVYLLSGRMSRDCETNFEIAKRMGVPIHMMDTEERLGSLSQEIMEADILVDAIFGTGISREVSGYPVKVIELINTSSCPIVSIDLPSGLDADTGRPLGISVKADLTITFGLLKRGLLLFPGAGLAGKVRLVGIGIPKELLNHPSIKTHLLTREELSSLLPIHPQDAHKGLRGRVVVIAGSRGMTGAAALCCEGALRIGAGLVYLCIPSSLNHIMEVKLTEAITHPLKETPSGTLDLDAFLEIMRLAKGADVLVVGPGIGRHPRTVELVHRLIKEVEIPLVVDADGINALAEEPSLLKQRSARWVTITPHPGEAARLVDLSTQEIQEDRIGWAEKISKDFGIICVLKGARTVISCGDETFINPTANPGMASGGVGDVLTGMIAGLIAQGVSMVDAAKLGVYLHGSSGDIVVEKKGEFSLVASDLIVEIKEAIRRLTL